MAPNDLPDWTSVVARPQTQLAGSPWNYAIGNNVKTFTLAADTSILGILLPNFFNLSQLQVVGHTSGLTYLEADPTVQIWRQFYTIPIMSGIDNAVDITIFAGTASTAYICSIPDSVAVVALADNPAPWQSANVPPVTIDFANPGQNNTVTVITAPTNSRSLWLHGAYWSWSVAAATANGIWQVSTPTEIGADSPVAAGAARFMDWRGAKLAGGQSLQWKQLGAAASGTTSCYGSISYAVF